MAGSDDEMDEDDEAAFPSPPPPGCLDPHELPKELLIESFVLEKRTLMPLLVRPIPLSLRKARGADRPMRLRAALVSLA